LKSWEFVADNTPALEFGLEASNPCEVLGAVTGLGLPPPNVSARVGGFDVLMLGTLDVVRLLLRIGTEGVTVEEGVVVRTLAGLLPL
jgi:hypothetical protein